MSRIIAICLLGACSFNDGGSGSNSADAGVLIDASSLMDATLDAPTELNCGPEFVEVSGLPNKIRYYDQDDQKAIWGVARTNCWASGGRLIVVDTDQKNAALANHIGHSVWIGLNDAVFESRYLWENGCVLGDSTGDCESDVNWDTAGMNIQPNDDSQTEDQDCMEMVHVVPNPGDPSDQEDNRPNDGEWESPGAWSDISCGVFRRYVCECAPSAFEN